jgi:hypothetical protein
VSGAVRLMCALALIMGPGAAAQARDFEMGGDGPTVYSEPAPVPVHRRAALHHQRRAKPHLAVKPAATP